MKVTANRPAARTHATLPARSAPSRGFSLVELMIALTLGLVVTAAVISTFISVHSASKDTAAIGELADNGRIAIDIFQQTLRSAGYMVCNSTLRQVVVQGGLGVNQSPLTKDVTEPLAGYEALYNGLDTGPGSSITLVENPPGTKTQSAWATTSGLGSQLDSSIVNSTALPIVGSDAIGVHTTYSSVRPVYTTAPSTANAVDVDSTAGITNGEVGIVSNCASSVVAEVSVVSGNNVQFNQSLGQSFDAGSQVGVFNTVVFYIGKGRDGDGALYSYQDAGQPNFSSPPQEIVPDVENMQILYGVDTSGSMAATEYVTADQVPAATANNPNCQAAGGTTPVDFNCVVSIKIALLVASRPYAIPLPAQARTFNLLGTKVTAPLDTRMRQVFEATVSLRNTTT